VWWRSIQGFSRWSLEGWQGRKPRQPSLGAGVRVWSRRFSAVLFFFFVVRFSLAERKNEQQILMTRITRLRIECDHRLQQSAPFLPIVVRFRAASAKTNNRKMGKNF
jgi:hypothetical protein